MSNNYFKSVDELLKTESFEEDFKGREFLANPNVPGGLSDTPEGISRREFLKVMAGGLALMGLAGCRRPEAHIVPLSEQPENRVVGVPIFYATSEIRAEEAIPLIVETHEARPTKIEGNGRYAEFKGATDLFAQAHVLDLYDPDRATKHYKNGGVITREMAINELKAQAKVLAETQGAGTVVVAHASTSPTTLAVKEMFLKKNPQAKWVEYSAFDKGQTTRVLKQIFDKNLRPKYNFEKADRILTLDCDFIGSEVGAIHYASAFAARRRANSKEEAREMNRLYAVESALTLTGSQADHRLRLANKYLTSFASLLLAELGGTTTDAQIPADAGKWMLPMAKDLAVHKGRALVICGSHQPFALQLLTLMINVRLGALGETVEFLELPGNEVQNRNDDVAELEKAQTIILFGANPAYDAPQNFNWNRVAQKAKKIVRYSYRTDETTLTLGKENLQVLSAQGLESWGLGRTFDGTLTARQPMIAPLFAGVEELEFWTLLSGEEIKPRDFAEKEFEKITGKSAAEFNNFLNVGILNESGNKNGYKKENIRELPASVKGMLRAQIEPEISRANAKGIELILRPSYAVNTGENANNAWLQECPEAISKLTWGNAMFVSPKTAKDLGYNPASDSILQVSAKPLSDLDRGRQTAPIVTLNVDGAMIKAPLMIQPGLADDTALIHLGYGHTKYGRNAEGFGVNVFPLIKHSGIYSFASVDIKLTSEKTFLACTQNHWSIEGRDHYREGDREDFEKNEEFAKDAHSVLGKAEEMSLSERSREMPRGLSAFEHPKYTAAQQWGLSIDLSACTGCNACVIACQSENNIPTVGREQILRGREMHWIRIDRYYASGNAAANNKEIPGDVDVGLQPMTCQHCERAPCEQVCPVNATVHDEQGLNVMAYNRCVGTRYCANNCPYKVRRFNFFDYAKRNRENYYWGMFGPEGMPDILKLQKNPDVTIRSRGVMEKCTLCVQRIEQSKIRQRLIAKDGGNVHVKDGIIRTACQQVCPTQAIVFGDVADEKTEVSRLKHSPRDYSALAYLNTRPRITYLARLRNQNRAMPDVRGILRFRLEQGDKSEHSKEI